METSVEMLSSNLSHRQGTNLMQTPIFHFHDLAGRTVALTGAANGIGRAIAPGLAAQGINLVLIDRDRERLATVLTELRAGGARAEGVIGDLSAPGERARIAREIAELSPRIDGIIHNAAIDPRQPLETTSIDFFRHVMATNVEPAVELTRDLLPALHRSDAGRIILVGSLTFEVGTALMSAYVAAKGAIVGLTRSLANELGPSGITVNCIAPGAVVVEKEGERNTEETEDAILTWQAVKRRIQPGDLLGIMCLLLSEAGSCISGQVISVNGGLLHPIADPELQRPWIGE